MANAARHVCFTINNPTLSGSDFLAVLSADDLVKYAIFQLEEGESHTPHFQGYLEYKRPQRFSYFHRHFDARAHLESRRGSRLQAKEYCTKELRLEGPWEHGEFGNSQGNRSDLDQLALLCKQGSLRTIAEEMPVALLRYPRGIQLLLSLHQPRRPPGPIDVILLYGATNVGKTRYCIEHAGPFGPDHYRKAPDTKWFDGYLDQRTVTFDDFGGASSKMSLFYLLQLLDRYDISVEVKGAYVPLLATTLYVTSNYHPNTWYDYSERAESYAALKRRFTRVILFNGNRPYDADRNAFFDQAVERPAPDNALDIIMPPAVVQ